MSLEQALIDNTAAIRELAAVWSQLNATANAKIAEKAAQKPAPIEKAKAEPKPEVVAAPKTVAEPSAPETTAAPAASSSASAEVIDYSVLQKAVFALAGKSREAAASVAAEFGVKTFKELKDDKWAAALVAVNEKLAELEAA